MPTSCSAPGCKCNYKSEDRVTLFKMPQKPDQLRHAWVRALRRDDIDELNAVYVCVKHFRTEDIEYTHKVPNGDGTFPEIPRVNPKLKDDAVPVFLPGCPSYYSQSAAKRSRRSLDSKDYLNQALTLSLRSDAEEKERFKVSCSQEMQGKFSLIYLPKTWSLWYPDEHSLIFMRPSLENSSILVDVYLVVTFDLSIKAFYKNVIFPHSLSCLSDIRQLESLVNEISSAPYRCEPSKNSESTASHISSANVHIQQAIDIMHTSSDVETSEHPEIFRLQFIQCQLENSLVLKNKRRYNILTQIFSLKTHLASLL